jgi:hypothetical protein
VNCSSPVVVVLSEYVPSELAVHVPVTCKEPVTGALAQPAPTSVRSRLPLTWRHDDVTFQVPTTLPPQLVTLEHDAPAPPAPTPFELPPVPDTPVLPGLVPELPPVPTVSVPPLPVEPNTPLELEEHAPEITPTASAIARAADRIFIEQFLSGEGSRRSKRERGRGAARLRSPCCRAGLI